MDFKETLIALKSLRMVKLYNIMKEQDLIELGFERCDETAESSGSDKDWHYYTLDIGNGTIGLITQPSNEVTNDNDWHAEVFEDDSIRFETKEDVSLFIDLIKRNIVR